MAGRVVFHVRDAFDTELDDRYDLVYWNNACTNVRRQAGPGMEPGTVRAPAAGW